MIFSADVLDCSLSSFVYKQSRINPAFARENFYEVFVNEACHRLFAWDTTNNAVASSTNIHQTTRAGFTIASVMRGFKNIVRWQYNGRPWVTRDVHVRCGKSVSHWWFRSWKFAIRHAATSACQSCTTAYSHMNWLPADVEIKKKCPFILFQPLIFFWFSPNRYILIISTFSIVIHLHFLCFSRAEVPWFFFNFLVFLSFFWPETA